MLANIVMTTSIHIPKPLLEAVDRKAKALKIGRNRLIVRALERELAPGADWSPGFFEQLSTVPPETAAAIDELLTSAHQGRGETVLITDQDHIIAELNPHDVRQDPLVDNPALAEAVRKGWITPAEVVSGEPPPRLPVAPLRELLQELDEDREDR